MIPYGRQWISDDDIEAVVEVLRSDFITQGPAIDEFESVVADYCGVKHAVAVSSGTAALHVAVMAAGLGPGDLLWTSPNTFVASANCARYVGADVDFVDIDPDTYNMQPELLAAKLEAAEKVGRLPDIVVPVHFAGQSCDMKRVGELAERYGFTVIEDAAHAIGATYAGAPVGRCTHSDMATFSFHPVKIVTTGEGGMIVTDEDGLAERLRLFRTHGVTRDESLMRSRPEGPWYYEQAELGYNYRLTDIQAALGTSQMRRLDEFVDLRAALAGRYDGLLADLPVITPHQSGDGRSAWHLYVIQLADEAGISRADAFALLRDRGIGVNVHYIPVNTQPFYSELGFGRGYCPNAEAYYERALTIPMYARLSEAEQDEVVAAIASLFE
jgi:UDP-4-amino-4,6-dideoxy-N-acetyl-beta-L-altrosamine transaminase